MINFALAATLILGTAFAQSPPSKRYPTPRPTPRPTLSRSPSPVPEPSPAPSTAPSVRDYSVGDRAFMERKEPTRAKEALELFRKYHTENPTDPEAAWRRSMGCYYAGLHLAKDDDEKKPIFAEGRDAGRSAIQLKPNCAPCHFWTAINMALYGQAVGIFKMLFSLSEIKDHMKATVEADASYMSGGAYRILGAIEQKLPGILGGSNDRAKEYMEKAIAIAPDDPMNYLFMIRLLTDKFDDLPGACTMAKRGVATPPLPEDRIESIGSRKELEEFLKRCPATS